MKVSFKILIIIRGFYTQESLSNHTTFRPIYSGATVPEILLSDVIGFFIKDGEFLLAYNYLSRAVHWLMTCSGTAL
jgi:hypothetical protein